MTLMNQTEFAKHIGRVKSYITELKHAGRLVMEDGKVNAEESIKLIEQTKDPDKIGVEERHENERSESKKTREELAYARLVTKASIDEQTLARLIEEGKKRASELLVKEDVDFHASEILTIFCNKIESMLYALAPQLAAESDEQKVLSSMLDYWESIRADTSHRFLSLAKTAK